MIVQVENVLSAVEVDAICDALRDEALWAEGGATASGRARCVKRNHQAKGDDPTVKGVVARISEAVAANPVIKAAAAPERFARLLLSRYGPGMEYGPHVDAPYIDGARTDVSFTLFLSDPETYDGGALVIDGAGSEDCIRLPAGALVLYPSTSLHRVERVTRGARLAAVGWIKSRVKLAEHRAMVFDLTTAIADLDAGAAPGAVRDRLANVRNNLLRTFGE